MIFFKVVFAVGCLALMAVPLLVGIIWGFKVGEENERKKNEVEKH